MAELDVLKTDHHVIESSRMDGFLVVYRGTQRGAEALDVYPGRYWVLTGSQLRQLIRDPVFVPRNVCGPEAVEAPLKLPNLFNI